MKRALSVLLENSSWLALFLFISMGMTAQPVKMPGEPSFQNPLPESITGIDSVIIGTGTDLSMQVPLSPWWGYSFTQTLYLQEEINIPDKRIFQIGYQYGGTSPSLEFDVEVWLAHTSLNEITTSVPLDDFIQVYDGPYFVNIGEEFSYLEIDPFFYNNTDNLIVTIIEKMPGYYASSDQFYSSPNPYPQQLCLGAWNDQTPYDPNNLPTGNYIDVRANTKLMLEDVPTTPEIKTIPDSVYFGEVEATLSAVVTIKVMNIGGGDLEITDAAISDNHFSILNPSFPVILGPGESELYDVQFLPTEAGYIDALLTFVIDPSVPGINVVHLAGHGLNFNVLREGFEGEMFPPLGWKVYDNNNDGEGWYRNVTDAPTGQTVPRTGVAAAGLDTYAGSPGQIGYDDWLITPQMVWQDGDLFKFYIKRLANQDGQVWRVCLSTTGDAIADFTPFDEITDPPVIYTEKNYDLTSLGLDEGDEFYIGFQFNSLWCWPGVIDDVLGSVKLTFEDDLMAISLEGEDIIYENEVMNFTAVVGNSGYNPVGAGEYTVGACSMVNGEEVVFGSVTGPAIEAGESTPVEIPVAIEETGVYGLYSKIVWGGDLNPENDASDPLSIEVISSSIVVRNIGTYPVNQQTPYYYLYPMNFDDYRVSSLHEGLYYASEMNTGGLIERISYYAAIGTPLPQRMVKVFMAQTDLPDFVDGALPADDMTLVFDGELNLDAGVGRINIELDDPFLYAGGSNLAVMVYYYQGSNPSTVDDALFAYEYLEYGPLRNGYDNWYTTIDPNNLSNMSYVSNYPVTSLMFETANGLGSISGQVLYQENSGPAEGAKVEIGNLDFPGAKAVLYANATGDFSAPYMLAGDHLMVTVSKYGYQTVVFDDVVLEAGGSVDLGIAYLVASPLISLSGNVLKSDTQGPAAGAMVRLFGMDDYETTTNGNGHFEFPEIWGLTAYDVEISLEGYQTFYDLISTSGAGYIMDTVTLLEKAPPPNLVTAIEEDGIALITWYAAGAPYPASFRYDDGTVNGVLITTGSPDIVGGSAWPHHALISQLQWYTYQSTGYPSSPQVMLTLLGLNNDGSPNPGDVLYTATEIENVYGWNTFDIPTPIETPNGFFFGISGYSNYTLIAYDDGVGEPWLWQPQTQWSNGMGSYNPLETVTAPPLYGNIFIRAAGMVYDENEGIGSGPGTIYWVDPSQNSFIIDNLVVEPTETGDPGFHPVQSAKPSVKEFEHYNVYRRQALFSEWEQVNDDPVYDTSFIDLDWATLGNGNYVFGVEAEYSNGVKSVISESNVIQKIFSEAVEVEDPMALLVYPNPVRGKLSIRAVEPLVRIMLFDRAGNRLAYHPAYGDEFSLDMTALGAGLYYLQIETTNKRFLRKVAVLR